MACKSSRLSQPCKSACPSFLNRERLFSAEIFASGLKSRRLLQPETPIVASLGRSAKGERSFSIEHFPRFRFSSSSKPARELISSSLSQDSASRICIFFSSERKFRLVPEATLPKAWPREMSNSHNSVNRAKKSKLLNPDRPEIFSVSSDEREAIAEKSFTLEHWKRFKFFRLESPRRGSMLFSSQQLERFSNSSRLHAARGSILSIARQSSRTRQRREVVFSNESIVPRRSRPEKSRL